MVQLLQQRQEARVTAYQCQAKRTTRFAIIQQDLCKVERQVLENAINTLAGSGNWYTLNSLLGPGHHVTTVGATAYVTRCQRVQAAQIEYHNCTQEMPVRLASSNNTVKFADPISFTLSNYATIIPCDPVAPPRWNIDGHWYCATPTVEPCGAPKELKPKTQEFKDEDFVTGLGHNIYSTAQIRQHRLTERIYHSREAQAIIGSYHANERGSIGPDGIWRFRTGLSGETIFQLEQGVLAKVSFLTPAIGCAWPWIASIGLILAMTQALAGCVARMYLVYRTKGFGVWLIPAALGMAFTLLAIPWTAVRSIWRNLRKGQGLDVQCKTLEEREQNLRGPGPRTKKTRLYPNISWADKLDEDIEEMIEPPYKKTIVGVPLREMSPFLRS